MQQRSKGMSFWSLEEEKSLILYFSLRLFSNFSKQTVVFNAVMLPIGVLAVGCYWTGGRKVCRIGSETQRWAGYGPGSNLNWNKQIVPAVFQVHSLYSQENTSKFQRKL